jgi:hypothetical protein
MKIPLTITLIVFLIPECQSVLWQERNVKNLSHIKKIIINRSRKNKEIIIIFVQTMEMSPLVLNRKQEMIQQELGKVKLLIFVVRELIVAFIAAVLVIVIFKIIPWKIVFYSGRSICLCQEEFLNNKIEIINHGKIYYLSLILICIEFKYIIANIDDLINNYYIIIRKVNINFLFFVKVIFYIYFFSKRFMNKCHNFYFPYPS